MIPATADVPPDTEENREICRKYCTICPTYKANHLEQHEPDVLFCSRGRSSCPEKKEVRCFCLGCELFLKYHLRLAYYCTKGQ